MAKEKKPKVGQDIYVGTSLYVYRGADDFHGGLCKITHVNYSTTLPPDHNNYCFVRIAERPGTSYNWKSLLEKQAEYKERFGETRGFPDPDNDPEFNDDDADWKPFSR